MRYETVILSEEDATDYSSEEDEVDRALVSALSANSQVHAHVWSTCYIYVTAQLSTINLF